MKILIVEDDLILAMINKKMATKLGHEIIGSVTSSEDAIDFCENNEIEVIFMDIHIEGVLDGIETMEIVRKSNNTPVIFISANSDRNTYSKAMLTTNSYFLTKPLEITHLQTLLDEIAGIKVS